jgi:hypothetical protein
MNKEIKTIEGLAEMIQCTMASKEVVQALDEKVQALDKKVFDFPLWPWRVECPHTSVT